MATPSLEAADEAAVESISRGTHGDPFAVLGPHLTGSGGRTRLRIRTMQPAAARVELLVVGAREPTRELSRRTAEGLFNIDLEVSEPIEYRLRVTFADGRTTELDDPYRFGPVLGDVDLHLFNEGTHRRAYEKLGAHLWQVGPTRGVLFAVWAPGAERVSLVGDFNNWDGRAHPMRMRIPSGIWELFVPDLDEGTRYKFEIRTRSGDVFLKADPYATHFEIPPNSASIVWDTGKHQWGDEAWMRHRAGFESWLERPMSVYEVHLGSWARGPDEGHRFLTYRELAARLVPYAKQMGFTHIELLPVMEHPYLGSWGYQVIGFFAPTSRYGTPDDFKAFVDACHQHDLGVILDWVPGHFPKDAHGLAQFDGTSLYEHADPREGEHRDWGTLIFNYGRHEVRSFLLSNALYWLREYHVDGLRVDAVASMLYRDYSRDAGDWIPNRFGGRENIEAIDFLRQLNILTHGEEPGSIMAAEESTAWPAVSRPTHLGGLGFTYKWNMGWMHDILEYVRQDPVYRRWAHNHLTFSMLYAYHENFILPFSHDEVVHGKGSMLNKIPGDVWQKCATLRALYGFMFGHPGKKLLFMGSEFGQWREWDYDGSLDWHLLDQAAHAGIQRFVRDLNAVYRSEPALHELDLVPAGFQWIDCNDNENSVISFIRRARDSRDFVVVALNFTPAPRYGYRIGVPEAGRYDERLNSDAHVYGGGNLGNAGGVSSAPVEAHGHPHSISLTLPPLACVLFKWRT
ncbi:MAG: 1,4-alpha-glucan branching protein GlgB [Acidobacteria bacterium]|nr:1,4-alpha-glucan branching protein GlgB [Acidobacteriota bacterium]MBI3261929.1 1,4-alpha-glucan branching protein GlgB [Acidobacteriota bacterium]